MLTIVKFVLVFVEVAACLLLVGVVLLQKTKGQGMGMAFGAAMGESLFGAQVGNVLTKTTIVLAVVFLVNTTLLGVVGGARRQSKSLADDIEATAPMPSAYPSGVPGGEDPGTAPAPGGDFIPPAGGEFPDVPVPELQPVSEGPSAPGEPEPVSAPQDGGDRPIVVDVPPAPALAPAPAVDDDEEPVED